MIPKTRSPFRIFKSQRTILAITDENLRSKSLNGMMITLKTIALKDNIGLIDSGLFLAFDFCFECMEHHTS